MFQIKALKGKPRVEHAKVKQLEKKLVDLDKKQDEKSFNRVSALIDAKMKRLSTSKTSIEVKVRAQQSEKIDNISSVVRHKILLE